MLEAERTAAALNKRYNFSGEIMTLGEFLAKQELTRGTATTRSHEQKRRQLEYKPLSKPVTEYHLWYKNEKYGELAMQVPKLVYDSYDLPKTEREEY